MDRLKYYRTKLGYEGAESQQEQERQQRAMREFERQQIESRRKEEEEQRRRQREEKRKREERETYIQALDDVVKTSTPNYLERWDDPQSKEMKSEGLTGNRVSPSKFNIPSGSSMFRSVNSNNNEYISPYLQFGQDLRKYISDSINIQKTLGVKDEDIKNSLIPEVDNSVQDRLNEIATKIKPGKEGLLYNVQEGWYEREVQNMLSKEYVRKMNGLSNNVDVIEQFLEDNPDIGKYQTGEENILEKFIQGGTRFLGTGTRLQYDSFKESAKDPMTYVWAGTLMAISAMAAPVTGGASLAASPILISQLPLLTKTVASLKPMAALSLGMKGGALKNMSDLEAGSAYREYTADGIDHRIAAPMAATVGAFNGIIEYMQIDSALSAIPGVSDLVENGSKMAQKELIKATTKVLANYGIDLGSNAIEEMAQAGITELGHELSRYLQDAPDPSTIGGIKVLAKTMGSEDFRNTLLDEGYGALQSMWLSPIVSSAGRITANQAVRSIHDASERSQMGKVISMEEKATQDNIKKNMDFILEKDGATDQAIRMVNETLDTNAIGFLMSEKQILQDMMQREDVTNQDKVKIETTLDKVNNVLSKTMYDVKEENADIEYKPTNAIDVESDILSDGFLENNEIYNDKLGEYSIELYKMAQEYKVLDTIKEELSKGTNKAEILNKITKSFPRKERRPVNIMSVINSVKMVQNEIKAQIVMNNLYNLSEVHNHTSESVVTQETIQEDINNDTYIDDLKENDIVDDTNISPEDKNHTIEREMPENSIETDNEYVDLIVKDQEDDLSQDESMAESTFNPADIKSVPVSKINVDPDRFQFRYDRGNAGGATKKLVGAEYNPILAGTILLWEDEYNDLYAVNGHHRVDLAKNSDVGEMDARIISHREYTAEEARALGAMINIAEDNATSIDVAKLIRDTGVTESDFNEIGVRPNSKIAKDGMALSRLNDWIFNQVATRAIPIERATIIGQELGDNSDGQNQIIKAIDNLENRGKNITNDILTELIAEVKGTARDEYTEMTLFEEETFTKNYSLERAELVSYVKGQLKSRVNLLKNVSKNKNAAILKELGNTIAVDDNVKEMNTADQALFILDKTLNYQGTKVNDLFNDLARKYADADNKTSIKKRALNELISLMEGGNVFETINQEVKRQGIKDILTGVGSDGEGRQQAYGLSESELQNQVNLFGESIMQLKDQEETKVIADETVKKTTSFKATAPIVETLKKNPIFNGLTIKYSNESGKINMSKEDLIRYGYGHLKETGEKYIYGYYTDGDRTITLNKEATRDTILEEAIHDIQYRLKEIDPDLNELVKAWESEVREKALEHDITIPDGYELLAQSLVYTEFGYASTNPFIADLIAVDDEIVEKFRVLLGEEIADKAFGFVDSTVEKSERLINVNNVRKLLNKDLRNNDINTYYGEDGNYAIVHKVDEGYEVSYFNEELGSVVDMNFDSIEDTTKKLIDDGIYQLKNENSSYDRSVVNELYEKLYLQRRRRKDNSSITRGADVSIEIDGQDIRRIREAILTGNFNQKDYQELIKNNDNLAYDDRRILGELVQDAKKKGLDRPNSEVTLKQFLYRFYDAEIEADTEISNNDIKKYWLYSIDDAVEKKGYLDEAKEVFKTDWLAEWEAYDKGVENIRTRLINQYKYFQDKVDIYRHRGLQYQLKDANPDNSFVNLINQSTLDNTYNLKTSSHGIDQYTLEFNNSIYNDFIQDDKTTSYIYTSENLGELSGLVVDRDVEDSNIYNMVINDAVLGGYDYIKFGSDDSMVVTNEMIEDVLKQNQPPQLNPVNSDISSIDVSEGLLKSILKLGEIPTVATEDTDTSGEITLIFKNEVTAPIGIESIQAVVMPDNINQELDDLLKDNGIKLIERFEDDRQKSIDEILRSDNTSFQVKPSDKNMFDIYDVNEYYQLKDQEPTTEERSWGQTIKNANLTTEWLSDLLESNKFMYEVKHNEDTMLAAAQLIDAKGEEYVEARLLSDISNDAVLMAASQILTYKYMESGEQDRAMALLDKTAEKATSLGQAIQILSVWGRQTPEGMLRYTSKRFKDAMTEQDKQLIGDKTKSLVDRFNHINKQAIAEIDVARTVKEVQEMSTEERATRDYVDKGSNLPEGGFTPDMLKSFENTIDDSMIQRISDTVNQHYQNPTGNLKDKLTDIGLNDFESEIINKYVKQKIKDTTSGSKQATIDSELSKKGYQRKGIDEQILDMASEGKIDENTLRNLVAEKEGMPVLSKELVEYIYNQGQLINSLPEGRERDVETAKLIKAISDQMPVSFWRKVNTFQTIAQLLNFKTTIRNLIGNDMFRRLDTFTLNFLGTPIDAALAKATGNERSMLFRPIKSSQAQKLGYKEGWRLGLEDALLGVDTSDLDTKYELKPIRTFKSGPLGAAETLMDIALRATDKAAMMATFRDSLEEQMLLNNTDQSTDEMVENAMSIALYRTFNDETTISNLFSTVKRGLNYVGFGGDSKGPKEFGLGELILKYPKTPANILGRAIDYSPAGVIATMLKLKNDTSPKGSYLRQRMAAEGLSRAIMGTGLIATGAILARMGVLTGSNPDDDEDIYKLEKQYGLRDFSVNVSAIGRHFTGGFTDPTAGELRKGDIIASYDWAEPIAMGLAIGADTELGSGEAIDFLSTVVRATEAGTTTLAEQPLLTGISNLFRYGDPVEGFTQVLKSMPSSFTPTLFSHVAQFLDGRDTDPYSFYGTGQQAWNLVQNRIPGLRGNIPSRYSVLGDERRYYPEDQNLALRALNIFLNPSISGRYMPTDEAQMLFDLYDASGNPDIVPRSPQKTYTIDGEKYSFTPESWAEMSEWLGNRYKDEFNYAINTYMRGWSEEEQVDELLYIITQIKNEAREKVREIGVLLN